jgi:hypothetical protein
MSVGQGSNLGGLSYIALGRETTFGTYNTCTVCLDFISSSIKQSIDSKILEQIEKSRTHTKRLQMGKNTGGDLSFYPRPLETSTGMWLQNVFGGTVTSATATGETAGGSAFQHTFEVGNWDQSYPSLCLNIRKGDSSNGKVFEYNGVRVNEMSMVFALDEPLQLDNTVICQDASQTANDVESVLTVTANPVLSFVDGRVSVETSFASLTSTSFWHVQGGTFKLSNSMKDGAEARRIGSNVPTVLPAGIQSYELSLDIRFDTTTAFDAMVAETELAAQLDFRGATISGSIIRQGIQVNFQKLYIKDAGDPEITGPDNLLTSTVTFDVLRDESASGYAVQAIVYNDISSYA